MCHIRIRIFVSNFPLLTKKKALLMFRVYVKLTKKTLECMDVLKEERETILLFVLSLFVHSKNNNESRRPPLLLLLICRSPLGRCS